MLCVGICDDDEKMRERVYAICSRVLQEQKMEAQICLFPGAREVLQSEWNMDILLLDVEMPEMDGIELKNLLQRRGDGRLIIYLTNHDEFIQEAFGIHVFAFVRKHEMEERLPKLFLSAIRILGSFVLIDERINSRDVVYVKTEHIYSRLRLKDGTQELLRCGSREMERLLQGTDFIRISRSVLVNMREIQSMGDGKVQFADINFSVSTRLQTQVTKEYDAFCRRNARMV